MLEAPALLVHPPRDIVAPLVMPGADARRRPVAVLFADICGFTRLVESTEPETVYKIMSPLLDDLVACVHREGGEVQQVLGDGFMAVFGLRRSFGDETERATAAGHAMLRAARPDQPAVHLGVEAGEVLVTRTWEPACFGVWGRAVNLAQRMCAVAGPGEMVLGPAAYAEAAHRAGPATEELVLVRGIDEPVAVHRITHRTAVAAVAA
jgi:class 3 adenylate cyclase